MNVTSQSELAGLRKRAAELRREHALLKSIKNPAAAPLETQAAVIKLQREKAFLTELVPEHTDFFALGGEAPTDIEAFNALPEPYRRQIVAKLGVKYTQVLVNLEKAAAVQVHDQAVEARRDEVLKDVPFRTLDDFNALDAKQRRKYARELSQEQFAALRGELPDEDGGLVL